MEEVAAAFGLRPRRPASTTTRMDCRKRCEPHSKTYSAAAWTACNPDARVSALPPRSSCNSWISLENPSTSAPQLRAISLTADLRSWFERDRVLVFEPHHRVVVFFVQVALALFLLLAFVFGGLVFGVAGCFLDGVGA